MMSNWIAAIVSVWTIVLSGNAVAAPERALPTNSIYQLSIPLVNQNGRTSQLADWRGKPVLVTMFYSSCQFVCPRIVDALKRTEECVAGATGGQLPVLMVTFDPKRDDIAALKQVAEERQLDDAIWTLARTDSRNVRKLAALLSIQYRELPSGDFNHTSVLILLDAEGRIVGKTAMLGEADPAFVKLANKVARAGKGK